MDVALRVAEQGDDDARRPRDRRGDARRDPRQPARARPLSRLGTRPSSLRHERARPRRRGARRVLRVRAHPPGRQLRDGRASPSPSSAATAWGRRRSAPRSWADAVVRGSVRGSIRFLGKEIVGRPPYAIAAAGIGYVPQGRRLFPSLSVDEHLRMIGGPRPAATLERASRCTSSFRGSPSGGGTAAPQLSGGEQQMLAIGARAAHESAAADHGRALRGARAGDHRASRSTSSGSSRGRDCTSSSIEQNLGVATALAERQLVMVGGQIATETTAAKLSSDREMQQRYPRDRDACRAACVGGCSQS